MGAMEIVVLVVVIAVVAGGAFWWGRYSGKKNADDATARIARVSSEEIERAIQEVIRRPDISTLIVNGHKIEAVRRIRELTGANLTQTQEAVERAIANKDIHSESTLFDAELVSKIRGGFTESAVRRYQKLTGADVREARAKIDKIRSDIDKTAGTTTTVNTEQDN